jgi:hypothetical protein
MHTTVAKISPVLLDILRGLYTVSYLADLFGMYARKTSSKYSEILTEHVSYSSIDEPMARYDRITRILNMKKVYYISILRIISQDSLYF